MVIVKAPTALHPPQRRCCWNNFLEVIMSLFQMSYLKIKCNCEKSTSKVDSIRLILRTLQFLWMIRLIILDKCENNLVGSDEICHPISVRYNWRYPRWVDWQAPHRIVWMFVNIFEFIMYLHIDRVLHQCSMSLWRNFGVLTFRTFIVVNGLLIITYRKILVLCVLEVLDG